MEYRKGPGVFLKACLGCLLIMVVAFYTYTPSYAHEPEKKSNAKPEPKKPGGPVPTTSPATHQGQPTIGKDKVVPKRKRDDSLHWFVSAGAGWFAYYDTFKKSRKTRGEEEQFSGHLGTGFRYRSFELDVRVGLRHVAHVGGTGYFNDPTKVWLSLLGIEAGVGFYGYSVRYQRIRMRHGAWLGAFIPLATKCRFYDESRCDQLRLDLRQRAIPAGTLHVWDWGIRLVRGLWLEISMLNVGYPVIISVSAGLRWESGGLDG
jgi:hypothetical protein